MNDHSKYRFRNLYIVLGCLLTLLVLIVTDPDLHWIQSLEIGAGTVTFLTTNMNGIVSSSLLFFTCKAMMDYEIADFEALGKLAAQTSEGAGRFAQAIAMKYIAFAIVIGFSFKN